jgi:hypothetical protein
LGYCQSDSEQESFHIWHWRSLATKQTYTIDIANETATKQTFTFDIASQTPTEQT